MKRKINCFAAAVLAAVMAFCGCSQVTAAEDDGLYTVTFCDGGEVLCYQSVEKNACANQINPPEKYGYDFVCWLCDGVEYDFTTPVTYDITLETSRELSEWTITFVADGVKVGERTYNAFSSVSGISLPEVPEKIGYLGVWEQFSLDGGDFTVNAVYSVIEYTATFFCEGEVLGTVKFTVEDDELSLPAIPEKKGYEGTWESYEITADDMEIHAVYQKKTYYVYFYADGELIKAAPYTCEDAAVEEPEVPERGGEKGTWQSYELGYEDVIVYAVYPSDEQTGSGDSQTESGDSQTGGDSGGEQGGTESGSDDGGSDQGGTAQTSESSLEFVQVSGGYEVAGLKSGVTLTEIVIPATYNGSTVVSIGKKAFFDNDFIQKVTISGGVTVIGKNAFFNCSAMTEINLPSTLLEIGEEAFAYCVFKSVTLPESLKTIGERAFYDCYLREITLPDSVETVEESAFRACIYLIKATIGKSVDYIAKNAFYQCDRFTVAVFLDTAGWVVRETPTAFDTKEVDLSNSSLAAYRLSVVYSAKYFLKI